MTSTIEEDASRGAGGRPPLPDSLWAEVARVYDQALAAGIRPRKAVAEYFGKPMSTAGRWVKKTRASGLLPATIPGRQVGNVETPPRRRASGPAAQASETTPGPQVTVEVQPRPKTRKRTRAQRASSASAGK